MDIHRCRFVPYPPSAINALAFSHPSSDHHKGIVPDSLRLAVGRANGDIEIWNPLKDIWFHETTLHGAKDRSIEGLTWTQDQDEEMADGTTAPGRLRLFSIGYSTYVTEWDLELGKPARHFAGSYGEVWCISAQPRWQPPSSRVPLSERFTGDGDLYRGQDLAIGCADGAVVMLSTADGDLKLKKALARPSTKKARVLSIAFQSRKIAVVGCADSTIRIMDVLSGQLIRSMGLGSGPKGGPKEILVWSVKCLPNQDIVSGDSTGEVRFWDGKTYSLLQRLKGHRADVLNVEASLDGQTVLSGGMDRRTTIYRRLGSERNGKIHGPSRWGAGSHQRFHSHDVKAMATFEMKNMSVVATGGLDTNLVIIPLREFGKEHHRTISSLPQEPPVVSAPKARLLLSWWDREAWIWHVSKPATGDGDIMNELSTAAKHNRRLVARIGIKGEENITSSAITASGDILAVSTLSEVKLFRLRPRPSSAEQSLQVRKLSIPPKLARLGARIVQFTPDGRWLSVVTSSNDIYMARIAGREGESGTLRVLPKLVGLKRQSKGRSVKPRGDTAAELGRYPLTVTKVAFSSDSRILVLGDLAGHLDSWVLEGRVDPGDVPNEDQGDEELDDASPSSTSSSASEDDEEDIKKSSSRPRNDVVFGQHWILNPLTSPLPHLSSSPLILTFRPSATSPPQPLTNGHVSPHPTRHNPHPVAHELPHGEDRLLVVTAKHEMLEFQVLAGRLTRWSRRNPANSLPENFRSIRDRAMGSVWDIKAQRERVWLYGSSWLCMFDLGQDLSAPPHATANGENSRKRKSQFDGDLQKHTSGAGSKIPEAKLDSGIGRKVRKIDESGETVGELSLGRAHEPGSEDDEDELSSQLLNQLRRGKQNGVQKAAQPDAHADACDGRKASNGTVRSEPPGVSPSVPEIADTSHHGNAYWSTFKYRPILGIVPLDPDDDDDAGEGRASRNEVQKPEVALIERPMWDVDLPPRYYGDQEWAK